MPGSGDTATGFAAARRCHPGATRRRRSPIAPAPQPRRATRTMAARERAAPTVAGGWLPRHRARRAHRSAAGYRTPRSLAPGAGLGARLSGSRRAPQADERDRAPDRRDPQRDRVVDDGRGGGRRRVHVVEHEHPDEAALEHADVARDRHHVGEVADLVGEDDHGDRRRVPGRLEARPQHADVEPEVADAPSRRQSGCSSVRRVARIVVAVPRSSVGEAAAAAAARVRSVRRGSTRKNGEDRDRDAGRDERQQRVVGPGRIPSPRPRPNTRERDQVDRARQQEQHRRAFGHHARSARRARAAARRRPRCCRRRRATRRRRTPSRSARRAHRRRPARGRRPRGRSRRSRCRRGSRAPPRRRASRASCPRRRRRPRAGREPRAAARRRARQHGERDQPVAQPARLIGLGDLLRFAEIGCAHRAARGEWRRLILRPDRMAWIRRVPVVPAGRARRRAQRETVLRPAKRACDAELLLDPQQLVVLRDALGARRRAGLDLADGGRDREVGDRRVLGLAGAVRDRRRCSRRAWASAIVSSVSVSVPIWLSLIRIELPMPASMPRRRIAGLVTKTSSPTSWTRLADALGQRRPAVPVLLGHAVLERHDRVAPERAPPSSRPSRSS